MLLLLRTTHEAEKGTQWTHKNTILSAELSLSAKVNIHIAWLFVVRSEKSKINIAESSLKFQWLTKAEILVKLQMKKTILFRKNWKHNSKLRCAVIV